MILSDPGMYSQLLTLRDSNFKNVHWRYSAEFIIGTRVISVHNVNRIDRKGNYLSDLSDYIFVNIDIPRSSYITVLESNTNEIQMRLIRTANTTAGDGDIGAQSSSETFKAYMTDDSNPNVVSPADGDTGTTKDDLSSLVNLDIHLIVEGLSEFRLMEMTGVFKGVTTGDLIRGLLSQPFKGLSPAGDVGYGVDLVAPNNTKINYQLVIPDGIKLVNLPTYIQRKYGVYATGMGYYLKRKTWYVYPLLDYTRFDSSIRRLTVVNVPTNEMVGSDNTYIQQGKDLFVFATGMSTHKDDSERSALNTGTGFRHGNMNNLLDNFSDHGQGTTHVGVGNNRIDINMDTRTNGLINTTTPSNRLSSNQWEAASNVTAGIGSVLLLPWESSDPELLYPGMPVKVLYKRAGTVVSVMGTLIGVDSTVSTSQNSTHDNRYVSNSVMTIRCSRITKD